MWGSKTMKRSSSTKILTTHVGSLPQPDGSWTNAATDERELRKTVGDVIAKQRETGLDVVNDGEYAKGGDWLSYTDDRLNGFEAGVYAGTPLIAQGADRREFDDFYAYANERQTLFYVREGERIRKRAHWVCRGPIAYRGQRALEREIEMVKRFVQPG